MYGNTRRAIKSLMGRLQFAGAQPWDGGRSRRAAVAAVPLAMAGEGGAAASRVPAALRVGGLSLTLLDSFNNNCEAAMHGHACMTSESVGKPAS
jgi:hypothetical protein